MSDNISAIIQVFGRVQMVGFRWYTIQSANDLKLKGTVRNVADGSVEIEVEGEKNTIKYFIEKIKAGPRLSKVNDVKIKWLPFENKYKNFDIKY